MTKQEVLKKRRRLTREEAADIRNALRGGEPKGSIASRHRLTLKQLDNWIARRKDKLDGPANKASTPSSALPTSTVLPTALGEPSPLETALREAGIAPATPTVASAQGADGGTPNGGGAGVSPPVPPTPTPEALIGFLQGATSIAIRTFCAVQRVQIPPKALAELVTFDKQERESMMFLAPYACEYVPGIATNFRPLMAGLFVGVWGISLATRMSVIKQAKAEMVKANAPDRTLEAVAADQARADATVRNNGTH